MGNLWLFSKRRTIIWGISAAVALLALIASNTDPNTGRVDYGIILVLPGMVCEFILSIIFGLNIFSMKVWVLMAANVCFYLATGGIIDFLSRPRTAR